MDDLIEALTILKGYGNSKYPTHCEHDVMIFVGIDPEEVSDADKSRLDDLGVIVGSPFGGDDTFYSYRFGSA